MTLAVRADVTGIFPNPPTMNESYTLHVNGNVFEGLVRFDSRLNLAPALAERWEDVDERTCVFTLRAGLRFSDGRPVTARDVAASLTAARTRGWITRDYLQSLESVQALDERRVAVRTRFPYPVLLHKLPWGYVLPADLVERTPVPAVGTGPYRVESWAPGRELVLARNPHFRGPAPAFERARFLAIPEASARVEALLRGEADLADQIPPERIDALRTQPGLEVKEHLSSRVLFLGLRMDRPPFADPRVRQAFDLALDREELIARALGGRGTPASQLVPPSIVGFNSRLAMPRPDRQRAGRLLASAGYGDGLAIRLDGTHNRYPNDRAILHEVARQLALIGVRVEVNALDKRDFYAGLAESSFHLLGWACESGDAGDALDTLLHSPTAGLLGSANTTRTSDPTLDSLIDAGNRSAAGAERTAHLQAALARAAELRPVIPLVVPTEAAAVSSRIRWETPWNLALRIEDLRPAEAGGP